MIFVLLEAVFEDGGVAGGGRKRFRFRDKAPLQKSIKTGEVT